MVEQPSLPKTGYAPVNGLTMYYEIHGADNGKPPLVLIHGGGSTITTTFGRVLPLFAQHRKVIAVELQGHGHTADIGRSETFEQDADDVTALLKELNITQADFFGFSNGGSTTLQIAIRHPTIARKLVVASAIFKRDGMSPQFWEWMKNASLENMPAQLKEAYLNVAPNPEDLIKMHDKDAKRMVEFTDWQDDDIRSIKSPTLVINGDADVVRPEHAMKMFRLLPNAKLAILPGGHGEYIGEIMTAKMESKLPEMTVTLIEEFLDTPSQGEDKK
ncbi:MAG: alpha/beta hydrolase [Ignavibacteriales bacterium]|nr:alpha/beta hydrolase [Ignavibacteriales bacterium]